LGNLGLPIADNLLQAGYALQVYNRTASKAQTLVAQGAEQKYDPVEVVPDGGIVISLVWDEAALASVVSAPGFVERLGPNGVHVSLTTLSPAASAAFAERHAWHGSAYVEAPIFGRPEAARNKQLWVPFTAPAASKDRVRPVLLALGAQDLFDLGERVGAATAVKLAGNFLIVSAGQAMQEALDMVEGQGVAPKQAIDLLTTTLFPAPIYEKH